MLADPYDVASELEELDRLSALNKLKSKSPPPPLETGYCLFCGEKCEAGRRWCNSECRDEWEFENSRR